MTDTPASDEETTSARQTLLSMLGITVAVAVLVLFTFSWLDSRKVPTITFLATPNSSIAIDVRGAIFTPGVVYLDPGSRMIDVVTAAGGFSPDADMSLVNQSSRVLDGQVITIPTQTVANSKLPGSNFVNINTASVEELKQLPGIGDVLALRIVTYRELHGPFQSPDELGLVEGISQNLVDSLEPYVTVSGND